MRQRSWIALAAIAALALVIGYSLGKRASPVAAPAVGSAAVAAPSTNASARASAVPSRPRMSGPASTVPLPPAGTPLKQEAAELQARADAGDAEAATRLFHDTKTCAGTRVAKATTAQWAPIALDRKVGGATPEQLKRTDRMLERMQKQLDFVRDNAALCEGLSDEDLNTEFPRMLRAAQLGDTLATDCYLATTWDDLLGLLDHPEWIDAFKQNAPALIDAGIARGDWQTVRELVQATAPGHVGFRNLLPQLTGTDPTEHYRYLKLWSLSPSAEVGLEGKLEQRLADARNAISSDAAAAGDTWAQDVYQRNFTTAPPDPSARTLFGLCHPGVMAQ